MSEENKQVIEPTKVEQHRLRGRNMFDVVSQLVSKYNESNGWSVVRVTPTLLNFEVLLERSTAQAEDNKTVVEKEATDEKEVTEDKDVLVEKKTATKSPTTKGSKKSATSADKLTEAKEV